MMKTKTNQTKYTSQKRISFGVALIHGDILKQVVQYFEFISNRFDNIIVIVEFKDIYYR